MAKMHSKGRGRSGSKRPLHPKIPTWIRYKPKEVELLIAKMAKEGKSSSMIGMTLRDSYGIPNVRMLTKKKLGQILKDKKAAREMPDDLMALIRRTVALKKHLEANKKDRTAKRGLQLTESKIKRLTKYYKREGVLSSEWKFDITKAGLLTE